MLSRSFLTSLLVCWLGLLGYAPTLGSTTIHARIRRTWRPHQASHIHPGPDNSESVSLLETANDIRNSIEWVVSPQSDLPFPLSFSRMVKHSNTLQFGQSVRVLECLADHDHCCLHACRFSYAPRRKIGPFFSQGDLVESDTVCMPLSRHSGRLWLLKYFPVPVPLSHTLRYVD
jgi:hypothetical protein